MIHFDKGKLRITSDEFQLTIMKLITKRVYDWKYVESAQERMNLCCPKNDIKKLATTSDNKCDLVPQEGVACYTQFYMLPQPSQFPLKFDTYPPLSCVP